VIADDFRALIKGSVLSEKAFARDVVGRGPRTVHRLLAGEPIPVSTVAWLVRMREVVTTDTAVTITAAATRAAPSPVPRRGSTQCARVRRRCCQGRRSAPTLRIGLPRPLAAPLTVPSARRTDGSQGPERAGPWLIRTTADP